MMAKIKEYVDMFQAYARAYPVYFLAGAGALVALIVFGVYFLG